MLTRNPQPLNTIGDVITVTIGRTTISLQWVREGAYGVTTYIGTRRVEEHCKSWPTEADARKHAWMLATLYNKTDMYQWPCGCNDIGWIDMGLGLHPCSSCNAGGVNIPRPPVSS